MLSFTIQNGRTKVELVTGLKWHPLIPDNFKQELVPLGTSMGADLYVYRRSDKSIVAMGSTSDGYKAGQVPLALLILESLNADTSPQNALVAVRINPSQDLYSLVLIRDGFILARSDITGDEEYIKEQVTEYLSLLDDWDVLIAPASWRVRGSTERTVESFLPSKGKKQKIPNAWRLKPIKVSVTKTGIKLGLVLLLLIGCQYGYKQWKQYELNQAAIRSAQQQAAVMEAQRQERMNAEPWGQAPKAGLFARACSDALSKIGIVVTNWSVKDFGCEGAQAYVSWERAKAGALIAHMRVLHPSAQISADGTSARVTTALNLQFQPTKKSDEKLPHLQSRVERLRDIAAVHGFAINVKAPEVRQSAQPNNTADVQLPWTEVEVKADGQLPVVELVRLLDGPGYRLNKVVGKYANGVINFQLVGSQYAKH